MIRGRLSRLTGESLLATATARLHQASNRVALTVRVRVPVPTPLRRFPNGWGHPVDASGVATNNTNGAAGGEPTSRAIWGALDVIGYPTWIVPLMTAQCPGKLQKNS